MSATIIYKGNTIATASNNTKTLLTAGKYMEANVVVTDNGGGGGATLQTKSVSYTPTESAISASVTPDPGYDGMDQVNVSVGAISSTYVGSGIARNDSTDLTASGATVTAPAGYYASNATKTIPNASTPTVNFGGINASGDLIVDVDVADGGYIADGTYQLTETTAVISKAAATYTPGTTDQTIVAGQWLYGNQTILGDADLVASNIKKDVNIFGVVGTYEGGGGSASVTDTIDPIAGGTIRTITASGASGTLPQGSAISKIILNGVTQMDLTADTVEADNLLTGETAHGADGEAVVGTYGTIDPYHIVVNQEGVVFGIGGADWLNNRAAVNSNGNNRRSIWLPSGDTLVYYTNTSGTTPYHLIPIPQDATVLTLTIDKTCQYAVREYWGSGESLSSSTSTSWLDITANTPTTFALTSGSNYVGFGLRSNSTGQYSKSTEPTSASIDFS